MRAVLVGIIGVVLVACSMRDAGRKTESGPHIFDKEELRERAMVLLKQEVRDHLKDPGSAEFRDVTLYSQGYGNYGLCGKVNARNGFGGYEGFKPFAAYIMLTPTGEDRGSDAKIVAFYELDHINLDRGNPTVSAVYRAVYQDACHNEGESQ